MGFFLPFLFQGKEGQVFFVQPCEIGTEYRRQGQVLERIVQDFQKGPEDFHFAVFHEIFFLIGNGGDVLFFQHLHELGAFSCDGAEENDYVAVSEGAEGAVFIHDRLSAFHHFMNAAGYEPSFQGHIFHILQVIGGIHVIHIPLIDEVHGHAVAGIAVRPRFLVPPGI